MTEEQRRVHNAYNRAYYAQHRDRILQNERNNREARNAYMRKYRAANYKKLSAYYSDRRRNSAEKRYHADSSRKNAGRVCINGQLLGERHHNRERR